MVYNTFRVRKTHHIRPWRSWISQWIPIPKAGGSNPSGRAKSKSPVKPVVSRLHGVLLYPYLLVMKTEKRQKSTQKRVYVPVKMPVKLFVITTAGAADAAPAVFHLTLRLPFPGSCRSGHLHNYFPGWRRSRSAASQSTARQIPPPARKTDPHRQSPSPLSAFGISLHYIFNFSPPQSAPPPGTLKPAAPAPGNKSRKMAGKTRLLASLSDAAML